MTCPSSGPTERRYPERLALRAATERLALAQLRLERVRSLARVGLRSPGELLRAADDERAARNDWEARFAALQAKEEEAAIPATG